MNLVAKLDTRRLVGLIQQFPDRARVTMDGFLEEQVRLLVSSSGNVPGLVQVTPPHSEGKRGNATKQQGESAVLGDVFQVYATPGKIYKMLISYAGARVAGRWWSLWKNDPVKAKRFLELSAPGAIQRMPIGFDGGTAHKAARGRNGRVRGQPRVIVLNELGQLKRYVKKKQKNVGLLAAAVPVAVGSRYGTLKGVPAWVSRHQSSYGYRHDRKTPKGRVITLGVTNSAIREMQRRFTYVLNYRVKALERQLPFLVRAMERKLQGLIDAA